MRQRITLSLAAGTLVLPPLIAAGLSRLSAQAAQSGVRVTCLFFSGERDPEALITDPAKTSMLRERLRGLPAAPTPNWPGLGWRGVMLSNQGVSSFPNLVRVQNGVIRTCSHSGIRHFQDTKGLEALLLRDTDSGPGNFMPDVCEGRFVVP
jgi:hypothetical protein